MTANPYIDVIRNLNHIITYEEVPRTGVPLNTSNYGAFTVITNRITDFNQIIETLPAIVIDLYSDAVEYYKVDQATYRLLPVMIAMYIPCLGRGMEVNAAIQEEFKADTEIKTLFPDLESVIAGSKAMESIGQELILVGGGGIIPETLDWEAAFGIKLRVGRLNIVVRSLIR